MMYLHSRITKLKNEFDKMQLDNTPTFFNSDQDYENAKAEGKVKDDAIVFIDDITAND